MSNQNQPPTPSPEQMQIDNIVGSIGCCDYIIQFAKKSPLTLENLGRLQQSIQWLEEIGRSLRADYSEIMSRMPQSAPVQNAPVVPTPPMPAASVTQIKGKKKK